MSSKQRAAPQGGFRPRGRGAPAGCCRSDPASDPESWPCWGTAWSSSSCDCGGLERLTWIPPLRPQQRHTGRRQSGRRLHKKKRKQMNKKPDYAQRMNQVRLFSPGRTCGHCLIGGYAGHGDRVSRDLVGESCTQSCLEPQGDLRHNATAAINCLKDQNYVSMEWVATKIHRQK